MLLFGAVAANSFFLFLKKKICTKWFLSLSFKQLIIYCQTKSLFFKIDKRMDKLERIVLRSKEVYEVAGTLLLTHGLDCGE